MTKDILLQKIKCCGNIKLNELYEESKMSEEYVRKSTTNLSCNKRIEDAKSIIDNMIASIRAKIDLKEQSVLDSILRSGALELEDGTTIAYHDMIKNGEIHESSLSIFSKDHMSHWEINGNREQYQIFNTEYGDKKIKTEWGAEINETISSISQQYNGTTIISLDNKRLMKVVQNEISGFETIGTTVFSPNLSDHSLFLRKGETVEYKGEYDSFTIGRATYDIQGIEQMQRDNCIYNEQRLNENNQATEALGFKPPRRKSDEEIDQMLQAREEILKMCNPLLNEAQQVVSTTLEKIKKEKSISTKVRKAFASLVGSKSLEQLKREKQELKEQEIDLHNEYTQSIKESEKKDGKDEI